MKKSFEETIQYMREQNWIKMWLNALGYSSLDNATLIRIIKDKYRLMNSNNEQCSIVLGLDYDSVRDIRGEEYAVAIRKAMHKWMFNY